MKARIPKAYGRGGKTQKDLERVRDHTVNSVFVLILTTLRDKHGWGKQRLNGLVEDTVRLGDAIAENYVSFEDLKSELAKAGIEFIIKED